MRVAGSRPCIPQVAMLVKILLSTPLMSKCALAASVAMSLSRSVARKLSPPVLHWPERVGGRLRESFGWQGCFQNSSSRDLEKSAFVASPCSPLRAACRAVVGDRLSLVDALLAAFAKWFVVVQGGGEHVMASGGDCPSDPVVSQGRGLPSFLFASFAFIGDDVGGDVRFFSGSAAYAGFQRSEAEAYLFVFGLHSMEVGELVLVTDMIAEMLGSCVGQVVYSHVPEWGLTAKEVLSLTVRFDFRHG